MNSFELVKACDYSKKRKTTYKYAETKRMASATEQHC